MSSKSCSYLLFVVAVSIFATSQLFLNRAENERDLKPSSIQGISSEENIEELSHLSQRISALEPQQVLTPPQPEKIIAPLDFELTSKDYAIMILSRSDRVPQLMKFLERYDTVGMDCPRMKRIIVTIISERVDSVNLKPAPFPLPDVDQFKNINVVVRRGQSTSPGERFRPMPGETEDIILSLDDDIFLTCEAMAFGADTLVNNPSHLVGYFVSHVKEEPIARVAKGDNFKPKIPRWRYFLPRLTGKADKKDDAYSMIATSAAFFHKTWLDEYWSDEYPSLIEAREMILDVGIGENLLFNFIVGHQKLQNGPMLVVPVQVY